jgi:U3 small nucleolar ribonucleoprotein protein LCP5
MRNEFFGEDWSMFENNMDLSSAGGAKKRKRLSAWERAKRKID